MKKLFRVIVRLLLAVLLSLVTYALVSFILSWITVNDYNAQEFHNQHIYLNTNGVHLDIIIPKEFLESDLSSGLERMPWANHVSFGWGDEKFYVETPAWSDLTLSTAFKAMFLKSSTLMHVTQYSEPYADWIEIHVSSEEMSTLQRQINDSFKVNSEGEKLILSGKGYAHNDEFYRAAGSYSLLNTCNSWVNSVFKQSGLKACVWTPFDFGLMNKYE